MKTLYVLAPLLALFCCGASAAANSGRSAMECVSASRDKDDIVFKNRCEQKVFVVWCGAMKYSKKRCGDGPQGNSFYTHSTNIGPGESAWARAIQEYRYAACEGSIGFGKDEIKDSPDGSFQCVGPKPAAGVQTPPQAPPNRPRDAGQQPAQARNLPMDIQQPQVTIGSTRESCPPGSSPARHANGIYVAVPPSAICIDNAQHIDGLDDMRPRNGSDAAPQDVAAGRSSTLGNGNGMMASPDLYCSYPEHNRGAIRCIEPVCKAGEVKKLGKCVVPVVSCAAPAKLQDGKCAQPVVMSPVTPSLRTPAPCGPPGSINDCIRPPVCAAGETVVDGRCVKPTITCLAPSVLQNGRCVRPGIGNGDTGGNSGGGNAGSSGGDAKSCIVVKMIPAKGGSRAHQSITNICNQKIGLDFCHEPSTQPGTRDTQCNANGRYFQQFSTMEPGQVKENQYSMPGDALIHYGACFGGEGKIKQNGGGAYSCR